MSFLFYNAVNNKITYSLKWALDECHWRYFHKCQVTLDKTIFNKSISIERDYGSQILLCRTLFAFRHMHVTRTFVVVHLIFESCDKNTAEIALYFDSFGIEYIPLEVLKKSRNKINYSMYLDYKMMNLLLVDFIILLS